MAIIFTMTQWYPRLCVYTDFEGWEKSSDSAIKEFALSFGNFQVKITTPLLIMWLAPQGECQNYQAKLIGYANWQRWRKAQNTKEPVEIVTLDEAKAGAEKNKAGGKKRGYTKPIMCVILHGPLDENLCGTQCQHM